MEKYKKVESGLKKIVIDNFIGGISWGLGVTVGASVVFTVLGLIFRKINLIPIVGDFVIRIIQFVSQNNPNLLR